MLDQLDDPVPFTPTPELVAAAKRRGTHLRRRSRLGVTAAMIPVILMVALATGAVYVDRRLDEVQRVDVAAGVLAPVAPGAPFNVLVVGTDGPRLDGADDGTRRSDTIMLVHVDQSADRLVVLPLPRDLVFDEGAGTTDRINTFLPRGGPSALISAIHDHLGLEVSHYVEIDFQGFERLIDAAGGISVKPSAPVRDDFTGLDLDGTCQHLGGSQALQLARARHLEYRDDSGHWQADETGDLGRMDRQQDVLQLVFGNLRNLSADPATLSSLLDVFADDTTIDSGFDRSTILGLATWGRTLGNDQIFTMRLPVVPFVTAGGAEVLRLDAPSTSILADFDHPAPPHDVTDPTDPTGASSFWSTIMLGDGRRSPVLFPGC